MEIYDGNFTNCKFSDSLGHKCEYCKDDYYLNYTYSLCYDNSEYGMLYKCALASEDGDSCIECVQNYYFGIEDKKCVNTDGCLFSDENHVCSKCDEGWCLNMKDSLCYYNDEIKEEKDKIFYKCIKTNEEGTACAICESPYQVGENGLCQNYYDCVEKEVETCVKCKEDTDWYHMCLNEEYGCVETFFAGCLKCNDIFDLDNCNECLPGYDLNEYSLQDDSSLFDEAPREIRATYPIPSPKKKIKLLIFGTRDSWYIQYENGEESWHNIPTFLQWRLEVQKKLYPNVLVTWLSMSSDGWCWFVRFADGSIAWRTTIVSLHLLLEKHHTKGTVSKVTFCRNNGWIVIFCDGQVAYNEIPYSLEAELVNYPHHIQDVTISGRKEWIIRRNIKVNEDYDRNHHKSYSIQRNGYYTWSNGLSSFLQDNLIHRNKNIKNIMLCSGTSKSYFLQYNNYHSAFRHHASLTKEINNFKERKKPYLNPFSVRFSSHTVSVHIKTDTNVRDLVRGVRNKSISFDQLPVLRVIQDPRDGRWWALENYWLWVLKEAGIRRVTVEILPWTREFLKRVRGKWDVTVINEDYRPYDY